MDPLAINGPCGSAFFQCELRAGDGLVASLTAPRQNVICVINCTTLVCGINSALGGEGGERWVTYVPSSSSSENNAGKAEKDLASCDEATATDSDLALPICVCKMPSMD